MKIILENNNTIVKTILPEIISGNYWIVDCEQKNLINVEAENGAWVLKSNTEVKITSSLDSNELSNSHNIDSVNLNVNEKIY